MGEGIRIVQFTDDIAIYITNKDRVQNKAVLEQALNTLNDRLCTLELKLEPKKTVLVEFSKFEGYNKSLEINIEGIGVKNEREAKFLGIWLDNNLKFHKQIGQRKNKQCELYNDVFK